MNIIIEILNNTFPSFLTYLFNRIKYCYLDISRGRQHHLCIGNRRRRVGLEIGNCHSVVLYKTEGVQYQKSRLVVHTYVCIFHCMESFVHPIFCLHSNDLQQQFFRPGKSYISLLIRPQIRCENHFLCLHILDT